MQTLADSGFEPIRVDGRKLAFEFVEKFKISHKFNRQAGKAGYDCLKSFLERNSLMRAQGMNRTDATAYFCALGASLYWKQDVEQSN